MPTHPLQVRDYRLVWLARFISVAATTAMVVVIGAQTYQIARGPLYHMNEQQASFMLGVLGLTQFIPFLILTPLAGVVADGLLKGQVFLAAEEEEVADRGFVIRAGEDGVDADL